MITDLTVTPAGTGLVDLDWTQVNVGDYNFDGEVNISDLTPLAINLGKTVDRAQPGAKQLTEYWVDGDSNGEVNIADLTPIAAHYQDQVVGYNIHQNGALLPGSPTVPSSQATKRTHLPNLFHVELSGQQSDTWVVAPVDQNGIEGADSSGNIGPVDLQTSVNIGGLNLYDLNTGQPGPFSPGKVSSRVIDPGDIVDRAQIGTVTMNGTSASIRNLPRNKVYIVDFRYAPTVNLSTGAPKGGSSIKGTSAVSDSDIVNTSVIFELPDGTDPADIHADITAEANPSGGYYIDLLATLNIPGDNPDTPAIETSYMEQEHSRLDCAAGTIAQDSDNDGIFDDNPELADPDHDCLSENEIARYEDLHGYRRDDGEETEVVATIQSVDLAAGMLNLSGIATNPEGSAAPYVGPSTDSIAFTELTQFLERTNANPDGVIVDPTTFTAGQSVEVEMYPVKDASGNVLHYWIEKVKLDLRTGGGGGGGGGKGGGGDG